MTRSRASSLFTRAIGVLTASWGVGMLIANRSTPDPLSPLALGLVAVAGVLLLLMSPGGRPDLS
jgi:hypothetical protein